MAILTYTRYVTLTGDSVTASAIIESAIEEAESDTGPLAEYLRRPLPLAEYTDLLHVDIDGLVYPKAVPVASVPATATYDIVRPNALGYLTAERSMIEEWTNPYGDGYLVHQPTRSVTYEGGWTADNVPFSVAATIARVAYRMANPYPVDDPSAGAQSRAVADASVSYGSNTAPGFAPGRSLLEALAPGAEAMLASHRWREDYA